MQEELEKKEADKRERKLVKQLERQQRKLAQKGIHVELATLRAEWEGRQRRDEPEIDVVSTAESAEEASEGAGCGQQADGAAVSRARRAPLSLFSIESLLGVRRPEPEPAPQPAVAEPGRKEEPRPVLQPEPMIESERREEPEPMLEPVPTTQPKLEVAVYPAAEAMLQGPVGEHGTPHVPGVGIPPGLLRVADLSSRLGTPMSES